MLVRFALISVVGPRASSPVTVAEVEGEVVQLAAHAVWDGFLVAWTESGPSGTHHVVTSIRFRGTFEVEVSRQLQLSAAEFRAADAGGLALGDDGHVAFAAAPFFVGDSGPLAVHLFLLSRHR